MDKKILEIVACPGCREELRLQGMFLTCRQCGLAYPVLGQTILDLLMEDAWPLQKAGKTGFKHTIKL
jgi:uncharacterized protein YbaR (Trm112 family)